MHKLFAALASLARGGKEKEAGAAGGRGSRLKRPFFRSFRRRRRGGFADIIADRKKTIWGRAGGTEL